MISTSLTASRTAVVEACFENARQEVAHFARAKGMTGGFLGLYSPDRFPTMNVGTTPHGNIKVRDASIMGYFDAEGHEIEGVLNDDDVVFVSALSYLAGENTPKVTAFDELNGELPYHVGRLHINGYAAVADVAKLLQATA